MPNTPDLPPFWTVLACLCSYLLARILPLWAIDVTLINHAGLVLMALAVAIIIWCAIWFRRKKTTIEPHHKPTTLIVEGPYRLSRNPIYLAMLVFTFGLALWFGTLSGFLPVVALQQILLRRFVQPEETGLRAAFGEEAETYIAKTRRWV
ncbi:MAG: isoprenylcysteine carboxylmethyltransferase family protein [Rhodobacteraceae bacterium]|nr:isoprenylcysteine carboxylmethyltransferase family protein [Paracoccaceae bacterium]